MLKLLAVFCLSLEFEYNFRLGAKIVVFSVFYWVFWLYSEKVLKWVFGLICGLQKID